jgi:O-antigen ligase
LSSEGEIKEASLKSRASYIDLGWTYIKNNPWFGYGLDSFRLLPNAYGTYSHNNFIEILFSSGVIGLVLYYIPYVIYICKAFSKIKINNPYPKLFFTTTILLLIMDYAQVSYYDRTTIIYMLFSLAALKLLEIDNKESCGYVI